MDNNILNNSQDNDRTLTGRLYDEDFILKIKAIVKSRDVLKQENDTLLSLNEELRKKINKFEAEKKAENCIEKSVMSNMEDEIKRLEALCEKLVIENKSASEKNSELYEALMTEKRNSEKKAENLNISSNSDMSKYIGELFIEAKEVSERIKNDAKRESERIKREAVEETVKIKNELQAAMDDINKMKSKITEMSFAAMSKIEAAESAFKGISN